MAQLIKCPTCGKEISSESPICPHCGQYNKPYIRKELKNQILKRLAIGLILFVIGAIACMCVYFSHSSTRERTRSKVTHIINGQIIEGQKQTESASHSSNGVKTGSKTIHIINGQIIEEQEQTESANSFENFRSKDLSAFMLHGKVKTVTYHSGRSFSRCTFNELGSLIKYEIGDNHSSYQYQITHDGNKLLLGDELGTWGEFYEVDDENRLVKYECGGDGVGSRNLYYYHDSNNCPRVEKVFSYDMYDNSWQEGETRKLTYSDIDEYGNWLTKTDHNDEILERRIIEYYSMDK